MNNLFTEFPHRRYNILTGEWILVSPHRTKRPWQGNKEIITDDFRPQYDPKCYLCPGNERAGGKVNKQYESTFVFENDFAALLPKSDLESSTKSDFFKIKNIEGTSRVICFSPRHDRTMAEMEVSNIRKVVDVWDEQIKDLSKKYKWVQIFENKGATMGCSNPHPHGQIWAGTELPNEPSKENIHQQKYYLEKNSVLLIDYLQTELEKKERVVVENDNWAVIVPFWALWPYETILLPKRHILKLTDLSDHEKDDLADILKQILVKYDNLFETSFPYTMGWHGAPNDKADYSYWQLHAHFYPPLLRSATVKKFMVGYEMLAEAQRDITAEQATEKLKRLSDIHYKQK